MSSLQIIHSIWSSASLTQEHRPALLQGSFSPFHSFLVSCLHQPLHLLLSPHPPLWPGALTLPTASSRLSAPARVVPRCALGGSGGGVGGCPLFLGSVDSYRSSLFTPKASSLGAKAPGAFLWGVLLLPAGKRKPCAPAKGEPGLAEQGLAPISNMKRKATFS